MTIALENVVAKTEVAATGTSTFDLNIGSPTPGNILTVPIVQKAGSGEAQFTVPGGWYSIGVKQANPFIAAQFLWHKVQASEPASYSLGGDSSKWWLGECVEWSGVDSVSPINSSLLNKGDTNANGQPISLALTPTVPNCAILSFCCTTDTRDDLSLAPGLTPLFDVANAFSNNGLAIVGGYEIQTTAVEAGAYTHSQLTAFYAYHGWATATIALAPGDTVTSQTITFSSSTKQFVNKDGTALIAAVTPLTGVYYEVYAGNITGVSGLVPDYTGTLTLDNGDAQITMIESPFSSTDDVTVLIYHSSFTEPKLYYMTVD